MDAKKIKVRLHWECSFAHDHEDIEVDENIPDGDLQQMADDLMNSEVQPSGWFEKILEN